MYPATLECEVIAVLGPRRGEAVKGIAVLKLGQKAVDQEIIQFCKERIAHYKASKSIDFIEAFPRTGFRKVHKEDFKG